MENISNTVYRVLGLMSGTSLDGLDMALCEFRKGDQGWSYEILAADTAEYDPKFRRMLADLPSQTAEGLAMANVRVGERFGRLAKDFLKRTRKTADFVASHGHTVFHQPDKGLTLQVGAGYPLMVESGLSVMNDFRSLDVALGGQGAPLVPIGDRLLFGKYDFRLNIGGIANVSYEDKEGVTKAFDLVYANMVLNMLAQRQGMEFDRDAVLATQGERIPDLEAKLRKWSFLDEPAPKSLGFERISKELFPLFSDKYKTEDLLRTATEHVSEVLANSITELAKASEKGNATVLVTGGGARNPLLMERLNELLPASIGTVPERGEIIDFKEALIFAFMGALAVSKEVNVLSSVTGAQQNSVSGVMYDIKSLVNNDYISV
ncbi:anhydro-N-acetylmuramic acid kinase [Fulvitalea axinellae]|uniref:Anhydro-N-acetylmuramic acid kinase n=1 Tax=Fulvitalea axinellae TaxID=1182444 RepID=A0AAU9CR37_9BACT|nr:anhydro-N-acetylmuramic acid kinase [Fulvitalea axinellae]